MQVIHVSRFTFYVRHPTVQISLGLVVVAAVGFLTSLAPETLAAGIIALVGTLFFGAIILTRAEPQDREFLLALFILGFSLRALLAVFLHYFTIVPEMDARTYAQEGWNLARFWKGDTLQRPYLTSLAYVYMNALTFFVVGHSPLSVKIMNCFFGILASICMYFIAKPIFGKRIASIASVLTALFPSLVFWSTQNLRDASVIFFLCLSMFGINGVRRGWKWKYLLAIVSSLWMLRMLRFLTFNVLVASLVLSIPLIAKSSRTRLLALGGLISLWFLDFLVLKETGVSPIRSLVSSWPAGGQPHSILSHLQYQLNTIVSETLSYRRGGSLDTSALSVPTLNSWKDLLLFMPEALTHYLLRPFPWERPTSLNAIMTIPEMLAWYALIPFTVLGMLDAVRKRLPEIAPILTFTIFFTLLDALAIGNLGALYRHRTQVWVFLLLFAGVGIGHVLSLSKGRVLGKTGKQITLERGEQA